jgi:O-antigen ligase
MTAAAPELPVESAPVERESTPMLRFGFFAFCIFAVADFSRFFEWKFWFLHVPLISSSCALLGAGMDGRLLAPFRSKIGSAMAALTFIYAVNIPLSTWRAQSFNVFTHDWLKSVMAFSIAGGLVVTFQQCRKALNSIGWGAAIAAVLANYLGTDTADGRLAVGRGTLGNSNETAFILLLGLPFIFLMVIDKDGSKIKRFIAMGSLPIALYALLRTGSRAGLIGLCILLLLMFLRTSAMGKVALVLGVGVMSAVLMVALPKIAGRYSTLFLGNEAVLDATTMAEVRDMGNAVSSTEGRRQLLLNSLKITAQHPIAGIGVGGFAAYMAGIEVQNGQHANWQGTHNTYTQISAEAGIPALVAFLCIIIFSFQASLRVYRKARISTTMVGRQVANVSFALMASLTAYAVCVFFDFVAYQATLPVLAAFSFAVAECAGNALEVAEYKQKMDQKPQERMIIFPARQRYKLRTT